MAEAHRALIVRTPTGNIGFAGENVAGFHVDAAGALVVLSTGDRGIPWQIFAAGRWLEAEMIEGEPPPDGDTSEVPDATFARTGGV